MSSISLHKEFVIVSSIFCAKGLYSIEIEVEYWRSKFKKTLYFCIRKCLN